MPWYDPGLTFECTRCGNCCTGAPGFTWVSEDELDALAELTGLDRAAFERRYTRRVWRKGEERVSLIDVGRNHDCVFYRAGVGCTVYEARPKQCRTWPFWQRNLASAEDWADVAGECPGVGRGPLHPAAVIAAMAADDGLAP